MLLGVINAPLLVLFFVAKIRRKFLLLEWKFRLDVAVSGGGKSACVTCPFGCIIVEIVNLYYTVLSDYNN